MIPRYRMAIMGLFPVSAIRSQRAQPLSFPPSLSLPPSLPLSLSPSPLPLSNTLTHNAAMSGGSFRAGGHLPRGPSGWQLSRRGALRETSHCCWRASVLLQWRPGPTLQGARVHMPHICICVCARANACPCMCWWVAECVEHWV
jgi:hypothetical protein